jgi:tetratricopeptide (TPR) repeat protein
MDPYLIGSDEDGRDVLGAKGDLERLIAELPDTAENQSKRAEYEIQLAMCHYAARDYPECARSLSQAIKLDPKNLDARDGLAFVQGEANHLNQLQAALATLDSMVKDNPESARARLILAFRYSSWKSRKGVPPDLESALKRDMGPELARALELAPEDRDILLATARQTLRLAVKETDPAQRKVRFEEARADIERAIKANPKKQLAIKLNPLQRLRPVVERLFVKASNREPFEQLAVLELRLNQPDAEIDAYRRGLKALPGDPYLRLYLAQALIREGNLVEARQQTESLRQQSPESLREANFHPSSIRLLDAGILAAEKKYQEAVTLLEDARVEFVESAGYQRLQVNLLLAKCHQEIGNLDAAVGAYNRALGIAPDSHQARIALAGLFMKKGDYDRAVEEYGKLVDEIPDLKPQLIRARLAQNERTPEAERRSEDIDRLLAEAKRDIANPRSSATNANTVVLLQVESLMANERYAEARKIVSETLAKNPDVVEFWLADVMLASRMGDYKAGHEILDRARDRVGDRLLFKLARVELFSRQGGPEATKALAELEAAAPTLPPAEQGPVYRALADAAERAKDPVATRRILNSWIERQPDVIQAHAEMLDLCLRTGDIPGTEAPIAALRRLEPENGVKWRMGETAKLIMQARTGKREQIAAAHDQIEEIRKRMPNSSDLPRLEGELAMVEGDPEKALRQFQMALGEGDRRVADLRRVALALRNLGRINEAQRMLREIGDSQELSLQDKQFAAEIALKNREFDRAAELAKQVVPANSEDPQLLLWLAEMLRSAKLMKESEAAVRRAVQLAPADVRPRLSLVRLLVQTKQKDQAREAIAAIEKNIPPGDARLPLAEAAELMGEIKVAGERYDAALKASPNDPVTLRAISQFLIRFNQGAQAEGMLRHMLSPAVKASEDVLQGTRRALAVILAARRIPRMTDEAIALIDQNIRARPGSYEDRRVKAQILAIHPKTREESLRLLAELGTNAKPSPDDEFLACQMLELQGNWDRAYERLQRVLESSPDNPRYLIWAVTKLLENKRIDEAGKWLPNLVSLAPDAIPTKLLQGRYLAARNQLTQAVAVLTNLAKEDPKSTLAVVDTLKKIDRKREAEALLRIQARSDTPAKLMLADYLIKDKRVPEALDILDPLWGAASPNTLGNLYISAIESDRSDRALIDRVAVIVEQQLSRGEAAAKTARPILAILRIRQGKYAEAESLYRQILNEESTNIQTLNNLAWLLAFQDGKADEALRLIDQAISLMGNEPHLLDTRAIVKLRMGQTDSAIKDLKEAISSRADETKAFQFHLAWAHWLAKESAEARLAFHEATKKLGLTPEAIEPLERPMYDQLTAEFGGGPQPN